MKPGCEVSQAICSKDCKDRKKSYPFVYSQADTCSEDK